jgi:poly(3-hydroxybutyrate) depolymerase
MKPLFLIGFMAFFGFACTATPTQQLRTRQGLQGVGTSPRIDVAVDSLPFTGTLPTGEGRLMATLTVGGIERQVAWVVPHEREETPPLVILFHGTRGDGRGIIDECGALGLANQHGVIVAAPDARTQNHSDWDHPDQDGNMWWETLPDQDVNHNPDLLLVRAIIAAARRDYHINPSSVYVMGHSNGAFFGLLAAVKLGDRLAGVALNSGGIVRCPTSPTCAFRAGRTADCSQYPSMPGWCHCEGSPLPIAVPPNGPRIPFVLSHGTDDRDVSVQYTCELAHDLVATNHPVFVNLRAGDGHFCDSDFAEMSWRYFTTGHGPGMN